MPRASLPEGLHTSAPMPVQRPPVTADSYRPPPPAPADLLAEIAVSSSWKELFVPQAVVEIEAFQQGAAVDWAAACAGSHTHRVRQTAGQPSGERRFGWEQYSDVGRRVVDAGLILRIDGEGKPSAIQEVHKPTDGDWSFHQAKLHKILVEFWELFPDAALQRNLLREADMSAATPLVSSLSAPHNGARKHAAVLVAEFAKEMDAGWLSAPSPHPHFFAFRACPLQAVSKALRRGIFPIVDNSWPLLDGFLAFYSARPVASNFCTRLERQDHLEWLSITAITQGAGALLEAKRLPEAAEVREIVVDRVFDFSKLFRTIRLATIDRWKAGFMLGGEFVADRRIVMGHTSWPQLAQRISLGVVIFVLCAFDKAFPAALAGVSATTCALIRAWQQARASIYGNIPDQTRPIHLAVLQDDVSALAISAELGAWLQDVFMSVVKGELGIAVSRK